MFNNFINCILTLIAALNLALVIIASYNLGFKQAMSIYCNENKKPVLSKFKSSQNHKESEAERIARITLENIENYGTSMPQKEVR